MNKSTDARPNTAALTTADPSLVGWWITDDFLWRNGKRIMGPFVTQELAIQVRALRETVEGHNRYFVDEISAEPRDRGFFISNAARDAGVAR